ncbi:MAG: SDR family NAD(P)-dependent oxidoreductase [Alphaproteobacteria bacterium]|nr:SDR family NAD(P)-dependent oxidoreductase [Alphaproteobacteria bacterium]
MKLEGAVAIITGSSSGVGAATARKLARRGARVVVNCTRRVAEGNAVVADCKAAGADAILTTGQMIVCDSGAGLGPMGSSTPPRRGNR